MEVSGELYPCRFLSGKGPWMGPRAGVDVLEKRENFLLRPEFEPQTVHPVV
jgi:hypothetical protein